MERLRHAVRFSSIVAAFLLVATPAHPQSIPRLTIFFGPAPIVTTYRARFHLQLLTAGLDVHMRPGRAVDLYFGPTLSHVSFGGRGLDDMDAAGAVLGLDVAPGSGPWAFSASARYLQIPLRGQILDNRTHLDAVFLGAGVAYRF